MNINQIICQHSTRTVFILLNPIINQEYSRQLYPRILLITSYWKSHITVTNTMMPFFLWTHSPVTCLTIKKMPVWSHSSVIYLITPSVFINLGQWNKFLSYNPTLWRQGCLHPLWWYQLLGLWCLHWTEKPPTLWRWCSLRLTRNNSSPGQI